MLHSSRNVFVIILKLKHEKFNLELVFIKNTYLISGIFHEPGSPKDTLLMNNAIKLEKCISKCVKWDISTHPSESVPGTHCPLL